MGTSTEIEVAMIANNDETIFRDYIDILIMTTKKCTMKCNAPLFCSQNRLNLLLFKIPCFCLHCQSCSSSLSWLPRKTTEWKATSTTLQPGHCSTHTQTQTCMSHTVTTKHYITLDFLFFVLKDFRSIVAQHYQTLSRMNVPLKGSRKRAICNWACFYGQR